MQIPCGGFMAVSFLRRVSRVLFGSFLVLFCFWAVSAQTATPMPTPVPTSTPNDDDDSDRPIPIHTDLVTVTLTVTDMYGRLVSGLGKNAFTILDNNLEQRIEFFSDADAPVSVGILFDISGSMSGDKIAKERTDLGKFINTS